MSTSTTTDTMWQRQLFSARLFVHASLLLIVFCRHVVLQDVFLETEPCRRPHVYLTFHNVSSVVWLDPRVVNHFVQFSSWYQYLAIWGFCGKPTILGLNSWIFYCTLRPKGLFLFELLILWVCWYNLGLYPTVRTKVKIIVNFLKSNGAFWTSGVYTRSQKVQCDTVSEYFDKAVVNVYSKDDGEHPLWLCVCAQM